MSQLFESTRSYLKTSTRLGRRMSSTKDDSNDHPQDTTHVHDSTSIIDPSLYYYSNNNTIRTPQKEEPSSTTRRPSSAQRRLSGLLSSFESKTRKSQSEDGNRPILTPLQFTRSTGGGGGKISPDETTNTQEVMIPTSDDTAFGQLHQQPGTRTSRDIQFDASAKDSEERRRKSKSSERTHRSSAKSHHSQHSHHTNGTHGSDRSTTSEGGRDHKSRQSPSLHAQHSHQQVGSSSTDNDRRYASVRMENEVPRGRSPTLSTSNSVSTRTTTSSSSYGSKSAQTPSQKEQASNAHASFASLSQPHTPNNTLINNSNKQQQYQSHVWRRNLLEESIMHSLRLGYAERHRSSSHHRSSRSGSPSTTTNNNTHGSSGSTLKKRFSRARKTREQAILAAALGKELPPCPVGTTLTPPSLSTSSSYDIISERDLQGHSPQNRSNNISRPGQTGQQTTPGGGSSSTGLAVGNGASGGQFRREANSPYQLDYNYSMTNITHSFASFTLELPEHRASHVMSASVIPNLFRVKSRIPGTPSTGLMPSISESNAGGIRSRSRRNSRTQQLHTGSVTSLSPSPRVLTGNNSTKKPLPPPPLITDPTLVTTNTSARTTMTSGLLTLDVDEEEDEEPVSPATKDWVESVFASLDQVKGFGPAQQTQTIEQTQQPFPANNKMEQRDPSRVLSVVS
ncbi:hypothetical protein BGZ83_004952 [Gryganskiella cystojenkinii]|nr:hypothetical protein BGZ83_004952 [Gryganskiella cystojenkinii]